MKADVVMKQMLSKMYNSYSSPVPGSIREKKKNKVSYFLEELNFNPNTADISLVEQKTYNKQLQEDLIFIYLDSEYRIVGILFGSKYDKEKTGDFESYFQTTSSDLTSRFGVIKNRKNLEKKSSFILTINNLNSGYKRKTTKENHTPSLQQRLTSYKLKKYDTSDVDFEESITSLLNEFVLLVFKYDELNEKIKKIPNKIRWKYGINKDTILVSLYSDLSKYNEYKNILKNNKDEQYGLNKVRSIKSKWLEINYHLNK